MIEITDELSEMFNAYSALKENGQATVTEAVSIVKKIYEANPRLIDTGYSDFIIATLDRTSPSPDEMSAIKDLCIRGLIKPVTMDVRSAFEALGNYILAHSEKSSNVDLSAVTIETEIR